jgi:ADP-ribose pyrophosphatase YjhB (NUDIX family)
MKEKIKQDVIKKLMHTPGMSFNQLWDKQGESNSFAYHLKQLEITGLIEKKSDGRYYLSQEGKELAVFVNGETGSVEKKPLVSILLVIFDEKNNVLLYQRLKEPFYKYYGFPGAKLDFGESILNCAKRELKEETNLTADLEEVGCLNYSTYEGEKIAFHHTHFVIKGTNPKGKLKEIDREGTFQWVTQEEFKSKELFPDDPYILDWVNSGKYFRVEMRRFQENSKFTDIKIDEVKFYKNEL